MSTKSTKTVKAEPAARYTREDLEQRDLTADEAAVDRYIERNKDALNASFDKADAEFAHGEYLTLDQAMANVKAQTERRRSGKA